jgi:hypothetical protein
MNKIKKKQLEKALKDLDKYIKSKDADLSLVSAYLRELADWIDEPVIESSNPPDPPPNPPGPK